MSYVRNAWYVAGWSKDLKASEPLAITILNERLVVWRGESGSLHALEDRCAHRLAPLSLGRCEGDGVRCMYHGLLYAGDGSLLEIPGQALIPAGAGVRPYAVEDRHGWIWIWMGDRAAADLELIPPAIGVDRGDYLQGHGHLDYAAEGRLISENLLDFSHLAFVHANSFGEDPAFAGVPARISPLERGIRYERWIENTLGSAFRQTDEPMDTFLTYDYLIPGVLILQGGVFPLGTARQCEHGMPDFSLAVSDVTASSQAVTPLTDKTARYFYAWGPRRDHGDEGYRDALMGVAAQAFQEDKFMIEAQQAVIDATDKVRVMPTVHDRGITLYNRLVERLSRAEKRENVTAA
jgi:vanillate O-demethylase monooxygenase subunit